MLLLNICTYATYLAILIIVMAMGLTVGMDRNISTRQMFQFSAINMLIINLFCFAGIGLALLFNQAEMAFMGGLLILVAGYTTFKKGGKSNAFVLSIDTQSAKYFAFANVAIGISLMLATFGLRLSNAFPWLVAIGFIPLCFVVHFISIKCGKNIRTINTIKIFMLISGILLFLVGLALFIQVWK